MPKPVLTISEPYTPELLPDVVAYIESFLQPDMEVFEFGGGFSTVWFAGLVRRVVWIEHDAEWYEEIERALRESGRDAVTEGVLVESPDAIAPAILTRGLFDLILVDCLSTERTAAAIGCISHLKAGGLLVLDDSHWGVFKVTLALLDELGWPKLVIGGMHTRKTGRVQFHQTTIYQRPA